MVIETRKPEETYELEERWEGKQGLDRLSA